MRYFLLASFLVMLIFFGCKKSKNNNTPIIPIEAGLKANFGYLPGTYWIYKDSVSGETDSAYVYNTLLDSFYKGCALFAGEPKYQGMNISIMVSNNNALDTERWNFFMQDSIFSINLYNNRDIVESYMNFMLFTYPFALGSSQQSGCVLSMDSGAVTDIIPEISAGGQSFSNAAKSAHSTSGSNDIIYNDCFYVNQDAGIIKIIFNHPTDSVNRVLELVRYHLVR